MSEASEPEGFIETVARFYGQVSIDMDLMKKAVNEIDAKQAATAQLIEGLQSQLPASAQLVQSLVTQLQELRADNQALRARVDELASQHSSSSVPVTLAELMERRSALPYINAAGILNITQ